MVYAFDPVAAPDAAFEPGALRHLAPGREGRLLDPRRTPVRVMGVDLVRGSFEVEVQAFEDAGARWLVPAEDCGRYQFAPGPDAAPELVGALAEAVRRLDRPLEVPADRAAWPSTLARLAGLRGEAGAQLDAAGLRRLELEPLVRARQGDPRIAALLEAWLERAGLAALDAAWTAAYVSNPGAGEAVKGHALVLADLGLCPFAGRVVRDPELFQGDGSRERRAGAGWRAAGTAAPPRPAAHDLRGDAGHEPTVQGGGGGAGGRGRGGRVVTAAGPRWPPHGARIRRASSFSESKVNRS